MASPFGAEADWQINAGRRRSPRGQRILGCARGEGGGPMAVLAMAGLAVSTAKGA